MRALCAVALVACASSRPPARESSALPPPPGCTPVSPDGALRELAARPDARVCLSAGHYEGPLVLGAGAIVWGPASAVIDRPRGGTVVEVGVNASLLGVTIDGRGGVFDREDAAVRLADGGRVEGVTITHAVFGVLAERVSHVVIRRNHIYGDAAPTMGLRGDTIRMWEAHDSVVEGNVVEGGRDVVVWYSDGNRVVGNVVRDGRYGTHFMYSHHNHVEHNRYIGDVVGVFVMYSHDLELTGNLVQDAAGAAGMAIGLKDSGNIAVTGNVLIHDHAGVYVDTTPLQRDHTLAVSNNLFGRCDAGVVLHGGGGPATYVGNDFVGNGTAVTVDAGETANAPQWSGNYWSDYAGYDLDGDGTGDVAFELRSLEGDLVANVPALAFFHDTPALDAAEAVTRVIPMFTPRTLLVDARPRMQPRRWSGLDPDGREVVHAD